MKKRPDLVEKYKGFFVNDSKGTAK